MDAIEELRAIEQIKKLKSKYLRSIDLKDEALYRSLVTEDLIFEEDRSIWDPVTDYSPFPDAMTAPVVGRDVCATGLFAALAHPDMCSVHVAHNPDIDFIDDDNASAIWTLYDVVNFPGPGGTKTLVGYGHYHDRYRRVDGVWMISEIRLRRIRIDYPYEAEWLERTRRGKANAIPFEVDGLRTAPAE